MTRKVRTFVRGMTSETYGLDEFRRQQLARRFELTTGVTLYVPQNHVCQLFAAEGTPLRLFNAQNRLFKHLGYDAVHVREPAGGH